MDPVILWFVAVTTVVSAGFGCIWSTKHFADVAVKMYFYGAAAVGAFILARNFL